MRGRPIFGSKLMLLELAIVFGFFALFSALCLSIYVSAYRISERNSLLLNAVTAAQDAAECYKADCEPILFFDENWNPADRTAATYTLSLDSTIEGDVGSAEISVKGKTNDVIFSLNVKDLKEAVK